MSAPAVTGNPSGRRVSDWNPATLSDLPTRQRDEVSSPEWASSPAGRIRVMLPAYNEMASLPALLSGLEVMFLESRLEGDVVVVNDGSTDRTPDIVRDYKGPMRLHLVDLQPNRGLAGALRAGLSEAVKNSRPQDIIVTMDADNSHPPGLIPRMVSLVREGNDVVIASRYRTGSQIRGLTAFRKLLSYGASILFRTIAPIPGVRDYTCGFRAYRVEMLSQAMTRHGDALIQQKGFGCMAELLLKLRDFDPIIFEAPLILRYDLKRSESKMRIWRTVKETLRMLGRQAVGRRS